jgi:hypothetical protein
VVPTRREARWPRLRSARCRGARAHRLTRPAHGDCIEENAPRSASEQARVRYAKWNMINNENHLDDTRSYDAFPAYLDALRSQSLAFAGQVALVHGDSHYFKLDKPLNRPKGGIVANFTRVETFGARNTHWVSATLDPSNPNLFVFEPRVVARNVD